jgi:hypothetical protein
MAKAKSKATGEPVNYIGISIDEFIDFATAELKAPPSPDGTKMDPKVKESYSNYIEALRSQRLKIRNYVFVFSKFIVVKINF